MRVDRILLVSLDNLGDLVFASGLVRPLAHRFPEAAIDVWCKEYTSDIARLMPGIGTVVASDPFWDRAPGRGKGAVRPFMRALRRVRRSRYDLAVLAAAPWRTAAAVAATGIPVRVGHRRRRNAPFLTHVVAQPTSTEPVMRALGRLLPAVSGGVEALRYQLDAAPLGARRAALREVLGDRFVALHPFASKRDRCAPIDVWIALSDDLAARGFDVLWIGSAREMSELRATRDAPAWRFVDRDTNGSLADAAAALSLSRLFVGHDSGPLHVAGALAVPVVGVFAPGEPERTFPQGVGPGTMIVRERGRDVTARDLVGAVDALELAAPRALAPTADPRR